MSNLKQRVHDACSESIRKKVRLLQTAIHEAQESANEETKSSAGDKYETGRAMAQLEIEKFASQLAELQKQEQELGRISSGLKDTRIGVGSLVRTSQGVFYIAVNVGEITVDGIKIFSVSPQAPVAAKMMGMAAAETFQLNGRSFAISGVE